MRKKFVVGLAIAAIALVVTSCQLGQTMYASCNKAADNNPFGADSKRVLVCENRVWKPIMTLDEYVGILQKKPVTIAPVPVAPEVPVCWNLEATGDSSHYSLRYNGVLNTANNATISDDYDCKDAPDGTNSGAVVWTNDQATATSLCAAIDPTLTVATQATVTLKTLKLPTTMWLCDMADA